jgi:putative ABC transport system permease protein
VIRHLFKMVWNRKGANALLMIEIFFSFLVVFGVLTVAGGLLARWRQPLGYNYKDVWVLHVSAAVAPDEVQVKRDPLAPTLDRITAEIQSFPQVAGAGLSDTPPYGNATSEGRWKRRGRMVTIKRDEVTDGFDNVMQVKVLRGRWFRPEDDALNYRPVVVDADLARAFFGDEDPVGQKIDENDKVEDRVVGVVAPYRKDGEISKIAENQLFIRKSLKKENGRVPHAILVRVRPGTTADFEKTLIDRVHAVAPDVEVHLRRMDRMRDSFLRARLAPLLVLGIVALFLIVMVALGLTGVLWQTVTRRTREIGLRRALGASAGAVRSQVLGEVALLATLAVVVGVVIVVQLPLLGLFALVSPPVFVFGIGAALAVIYAITLLCGAYPSWLASTVEPAEALRYE